MCSWQSCFFTGLYRSVTWCTVHRYTLSRKTKKQKQKTKTTNQPNKTKTRQKKATTTTTKHFRKKTYLSAVCKPPKWELSMKKNAIQKQKHQGVVLNIPLQQNFFHAFLDLPHLHTVFWISSYTDLKSKDEAICLPLQKTGKRVKLLFGIWQDCLCVKSHTEVPKQFGSGLSLE